MHVGGRGSKPGNKGERAPRDPEKAKEYAEKQKEQLDAQLMRFNQRTGGNVEIFKEAASHKLDDQLKNFMATAKAPEAAGDNQEAPAEAGDEEIR